MINYLLTILACSLYCFGWWIVTSEGKILSPLKSFAEKWLPDALYKPLFGCVVCFGSIHGGTMYYLITGDLKMLLPAIVSICGLNYMMSVKYGD